MDYLYRTSKLSVYKIDSLKLSSKQDETLNDFKIRVQDRLNEKLIWNQKKIKTKYLKDSDSLDLNYQNYMKNQTKSKEKQMFQQLILY